MVEVAGCPNWNKSCPKGRREAGCRGKEAVTDAEILECSRIIAQGIHGLSGCGSFEDPRNYGGDSGTDYHKLYEENREY